MCTTTERSTKCWAGIVMAPLGKVVRSAHTGSGLPVKVVVPLLPSVMPSPLTVTVTGETLGFNTRIATAAVSPGRNVTGSGGTETAIERGPFGTGLGDAVAATPTGTRSMLAPIARKIASRPLARLTLVRYSGTNSAVVRGGGVGDRVRIRARRSRVVDRGLIGDRDRVRARSGCLRARGDHISGIAVPGVLGATGEGGVDGEERIAHPGSGHGVSRGIGRRGRPRDRGRHACRHLWNGWIPGRCTLQACSRVRYRERIARVRVGENGHVARVGLIGERWKTWVHVQGECGGVESKGEALRDHDGFRGVAGGKDQRGRRAAVDHGRRGGVGGNRRGVTSG